MDQNRQLFNPENLPLNRSATWFELVTLYAFLCFKENNCDWTVIETGLGGRLDSTNIIYPKACVIMPIELEHPEFLGDTIEKIAYEKAGIIKEGIPVFIAKQKKEAKKVIKKVATEKNAPIYFYDEFLKNYKYKIVDKKSKVKLIFNKKYKNLFPRPINLKLN